MRATTVRRTVLTILAVLMCLGLSSCGEGCPIDVSKTEATAIEIWPSDESVEPGGTVQLNIRWTMSNGTFDVINHDIMWKVTAGGGTISDSGLFTAPSALGTSTVIALNYHNGQTLTDTTHVYTTSNGLSPSIAPSPTATGERYAGETKQLFYNGNDSGVGRGGKAPTFTLDEACTITEIITYHWAAYSLGTIALKGADGVEYGPWDCTGTATTNAPEGSNWYWHAKPNITLQPGSYTVIDSEPGTWSQNGGSHGYGMVWVYGTPQ